MTEIKVTSPNNVDGIDFSTLAPDKLELIRQLLCANQPKPEKVSKIVPSYHLIHTIKCRTCGYVKEEYFIMEWDNKLKGRIALRLYERPTDFRKMGVKVGWCEKCEEFLHTLSHDHLVSLVKATLKGKWTSAE